MPVVAMFFGVQFRCFFVMLGGMHVMAMSDLGMVRGLFVIAGLVVLGGFTMVLGRMLVVMRGVFVVLVDLVAFHGLLPGFVPTRSRSIAGHR